MIEWLFGCRHKHTSRVWTPKNHPEKSRVVCLTCGQEFHYDLHTMRVGKRLPAPRPRAWDDGIPKSNTGQTINPTLIDKEAL